MKNNSDNAPMPESCLASVSGIPRITYSNEYKSRHGFADFENNLFQITSGENIVETCNLVKVPKYTYTNTYVEKYVKVMGGIQKVQK